MQFMNLCPLFFCWVQLMSSGALESCHKLSEWSEPCPPAGPAIVHWRFTSSPCQATNVDADSQITWRASVSELRRLHAATTRYYRHSVAAAGCSLYSCSASDLHPHRSQLSGPVASYTPSRLPRESSAQHEQWQQ